jgi:DNA-binding transcriptional LysR family regulator
MKLDSLSMQDLGIVSDLPGYRSIRALATAKSIPLNYISRLLRTLEEELGCMLIERSTAGFRLTPFGQSFTMRAGEVHRHFNGLLDLAETKRAKVYSSTFTIGGPGFANVVFGPVIGKIITEIHRGYGVRFIDLETADAVKAAKAGCLDMLVAMEDLDLGDHWSSHFVGNISWSLFCRSDHPLTKKGPLAMKDLSPYTLITEVSWSGQHISANEKAFPQSIPVAIGAVATKGAAAALAICEHSDYLAYVPKILPSKVRFKVSPLAFSDLQDRSRSLFFFVQNCRVPNIVSQRVFSALADALGNKKG